MITLLSFFFFFNDTATTEIYTLSLHDALPISAGGGRRLGRSSGSRRSTRARDRGRIELQRRGHRELLAHAQGQGDERDPVSLDRLDAVVVVEHLALAHPQHAIVPREHHARRAVVHHFP